jgi:two-component system, LytTR family, sensor histidine kinase AlgZ
MKDSQGAAAHHHTRLTGTGELSGSSDGALDATPLVSQLLKARLWKWLRRIALPGIFSSIAVTILLVAFDRAAGLADILQEFSIAALYSLCIGVILAAVMPAVWGRSGDWAPPLRWLTRFGTIAAGTALGALLSGVCLLFAFRGHYGFWPSFWRSYSISLVLASTIASSIATFETYREQLQTSRMKLKAEELGRERALKLATAARLSSLESRVHPHFLFNTLNSVASLIHEDPKRAETMVNQLAELLRFSLDSTQGGLVPLEREMKIVEDYLAIEQTRFGERLRYSIELEPGLGLTLIPPLAVQTLVENSLKFAVGPRVQGARICIAAQIDLGLLRLEVADDGPGFSCAGIPAGHGLNNLEERLTAFYGEKAKLHIHSSGAGTTVTLSLPLSVAKAA